MPVSVTCGAVIAHHYTYAPPRYMILQYRWIFNQMSVSLWNNLGDPVFDGVGLAGFKSRAHSLLLVLLLDPFLSSTVFPFSSFILWVGIVGLWSSD